MTIVSVFGASWLDPDGRGWQQAYRCGSLLAEAGFVVATGGYGGAMEAVSQGAVDSGGHVVGVTAPPIFPRRKGPNRWVMEERPTDSLTERLHQLIHPSSAVIALPGSIGTLTELLVAWNEGFIAQLGGATPPPVIAVGERWQRLVTMLAEELLTDPAIVACVGTADEAVAAVAAALADELA